MPPLTKAAIDRLNAALNLPAQGWEQDWELELADRSRLGEFVVTYRSLALTPDDKFALMLLILASVDDWLGYEVGVPEEWSQIVELLRADWNLHRASVEYWVCEGADEPDGWFRLTPLLRSAFSR